MKKNKKNKGFTLFELLVSISIIGILTALASVAFSGAQKKARDARRVQDMKSVQTAAEQYYSQANYVYPANTAVASWTVNSQAVLSMFPVDPKNDTTYFYNYIPAGSNTTYCSCARVENTNNGNSTNNACNFVTPGPTALYFCVKNQQ